MKLVFEQRALDDLRHWVRHDRRKAVKIIELVQSTLSDPFHGIGKPEPLKYELAHCWSRRIDQEHRLVYRVEGDELIVLSCRYHYGQSADPHGFSRSLRSLAQ
jgi:toxin YoeB